MVSFFKFFRAEETAAVMVEMAIALPLLLTLLLGFVDFGYAFYQWNAANKAVQVGARLAEVSDPVAEGVKAEAGIPADIVNAGSVVDPTTDLYHYKCIGDLDATTCVCDEGKCHSLTADQTAFDLVYYGDDGTCQGTDHPGRPGMCDFFPGLEPDEVQIEYLATGLGFWGRPGGPVPTIKVSIINHQFQFFFLGALLKLAHDTITMPNMLSTVTGEDLDSSAP
jgi:hypothetical protein